MTRREFFGLVGGAAVWPLAARAQQPQAIRRIGVVLAVVEDDPEMKTRIAAFRQELRELGWIEGFNIQIEYRWAGDDPTLARKFATELVAQQPDVLFAAPTSMAAIVKDTTRSVPIIFAQVADPVAAGLVADTAHPEGNITGFSHFHFDIGAKWLELLKELAPDVVRVAVLYDPANRASTGYLPVMHDAARKLGVGVYPVEVKDRTDLEHSLDALAREPNGGFILIPGPVMGAQRKLIVSLAQRLRLPSVYSFRYHPAGGGLASYGVDLIDLYRRAASYVDRVLKGEKVVNLPVQAPTKYELVVNQRRARELDLTISPSLLARADEVIE